MAWSKAWNSFGKIPSLLLQGKYDYDFDGIPLRPQRLGPAKRINLLKVGLDAVIHSSFAHGLPPVVQVEPTNLCNLKCPLCPAGDGSMKRPRGQMPLETFQTILEQFGETLVSVYLHGFGEPFLNPDLPRMIQACTERGILSLVATNGNVLLDQSSALKIVDAGLGTMVIAADGSTQEIYRTYRRNGDIEKVKRFTALIEEAKAQRRSPYPYTALRCIVTKDNQEDQAQLEKLARELGVNMFASKSLGCLVHKDDFRDHEPTKQDLRRFAYENGKRIRKNRILCPFPFRQPFICWDGTLLGCGYDVHGDVPLGTVGDQESFEIWNSPQAMRLRWSIREGRGRPDFCGLCPYQDRVRDTSVLKNIELRPIAQSQQKKPGSGKRFAE